MSGINDLKEKSKHQLNSMKDKKIGLSEMIGNQPDGKLDNHKHGNTANQQSSQPTSNSATQPADHMPINSTIQSSGNLFLSEGEHQMKRSQNRKPPSYKMTFNLREDIYTAFNKLYAHRMLQGRMTEKSEMICEAIQCLIKMEELNQNKDNNL